MHICATPLLSALVPAGAIRMAAAHPLLLSARIPARTRAVRASSEPPPLDVEALVRRIVRQPSGRALTFAFGSQAVLLAALCAFMLSFAPAQQRADAAARRTACAEVSFGAGPIRVCAQPLPAGAAIPSISEYDAVQYKSAAPAPAAPPADASSLAAADGLRLVSSGLKRAEVLVESGNLEAVRTLLREPIFSEFLGYSPGVRGNAANLKPSAALVAAGADRDEVQDLLLALKRLDEFCLANRVVIFNEEDLAQVKDLMATSGRDGSPSGKLDLGEARELLKEANDGVARVRSQIR